MELDMYGKVRELTGEQDFIPFRFPGQYHDLEMELYYNRFRYYDLEMGMYTQQGPIGLARKILLCTGMVEYILDNIMIHTMFIHMPVESGFFQVTRKVFSEFF
ncbi:RHS repeat domain-containing protein [Lysinibacillus xylanilyticus]|uniref:RHS repeat domain-containing protein n=1 Tax=Lysinibacillus xylanilyticus TaxID=582475 RepID=UPI003D032C7F